MKTYIGTKIINAKPMTWAAYSDLCGWAVTDNKNGNNDGYLVEYTDGGNPNLTGFDGYVSWSPKSQFDSAYHEFTNMNFGMALEAMKRGFKVARSGWNGKGMWLVLVPGNPDVKTTAGSPYHNAGILQTEILPHIDMYTTNAEGRRAMLPGWLASQTDMLAEDWLVI